MDRLGKKELPAKGRCLRYLSWGTVLLGVILGAITRGIPYDIAWRPARPLGHPVWLAMHILSTSATTLLLAGYMLAAGLLFSRKCWLAIAIVWFPTMGSMAWLAWTYSYQFMYPSPDIYQPNYRPVIFPDAVLEISFVLFWLTLPLGALAGVYANEVEFPEPASMARPATGVGQESQPTSTQAAEDDVSCGRQ